MSPETVTDDTTRLTDLMLETPDLAAERLQELRRLMPDLFTADGALDPEALKAVAGAGQAAGADRYAFTWFGKERARREAFTPTSATLVPDEVRSFRGEAEDAPPPPHSIIEGENLEVLKLLLASYRDGVKCIYIDPPYNTGKDFVYSDNYTEDRRRYWEETGVTQEGVRMDSNTRADGRFHSNWLNLMYPRLLVARQLLKPDGVIFISIDDNEVHHLRKLCDEVFGEENFVGQMVWERGRKNDAKLISFGHEYVLVFMKSKESSIIWREAKPGADEILAAYQRLIDEHDDNYEAIQTGIRKFYAELAKSNPGHPALKHKRYNRVDRNGLWRDRDLSWPGGGGPTYDVIHPVTGKACAVPERGWGLSTIEKFNLYYDHGFIEFRADHTEPPMLKRYLNYVSTDFDPDARRISVLDDEDEQEVNQQVMPSVFYKSAQPIVRAFRELMGAKVFDNPKDPILLARWMGLVTNKQDLILDFFAGSGTTAHAVMELNEKDGGNRRAILVQIPEVPDPKSEAAKAGYTRISDITISRARRAAQKLIAARPQPADDADSDTPPADHRFNVFSLRPSHFPRAQFSPDPQKAEAENVEALRAYIAEKETALLTAFNAPELLAEVLLKSGFPLDAAVQRVPDAEHNTVWYATGVRPADGSSLEACITLDAPLHAETVRWASAHPARRFICLERALDTTMKWNLKHALGERFTAL